MLDRNTFQINFQKALNLPLCNKLSNAGIVATPVWNPHCACPDASTDIRPVFFFVAFPPIRKFLEDNWVSTTLQ